MRRPGHWTTPGRESSTRPRAARRSASVRSTRRSTRRVTPAPCEGDATHLRTARGGIAILGSDPVFASFRQAAAERALAGPVAGGGVAAHKPAGGVHVGLEVPRGVCALGEPAGGEAAAALAREHPPLERRE